MTQYFLDCLVTLAKYGTTGNEIAVEQQWLQEEPWAYPVAATKDGRQALLALDVVGQCFAAEQRAGREG
jgi:hypothetical protein